MSIESLNFFTSLSQSKINSVIQCESIDNVRKFIYSICHLIDCEDCLLIVSKTDCEDVTLIHNDGEKNIERWSLLDFIELMHQNNDLTFLEHEGMIELGKLTGMFQFEKFPSSVYVTSQLSSSVSLTLILFRDDVPFNRENKNENQTISKFLSNVLNTIFIGENAKQVEDEFRRLSRERSIWMESLAWINESKVDETQKDSTFEFYQKLLFQLKTLVNIKDTFLAEVSPEKDLKLITSEGDETQLETLKDEIIDIIRKNDGAEHRFYKLTRRLKNWAEERNEHILVVLLRVRRKSRLVAALISSESFSLLQTMIIRLFCDGVENILERRELLGSIQEQNKLLIKEKDEQKALIAKLEAAQEQLLQSEKMASIGQLAAGVAHEINNPVGYISSNLTSLKSYMDDIYRLLEEYEKLESRGKPLDEDIKSISELKNNIDFEFLKDDTTDILSESFEGIGRVKKIVSDLKDFSRIGQQDWSMCDIHHGIESTLNIVHNEIKYKATLEKDYGDLPQIECIPSQLNQVFLNLLVNAGHAISDKGIIKIKTFIIDNERIGIEISDNGSGIPKAIASRIFDPFFTTKPVGKGTGLGLSLSYGIIERHGGKIRVDSEKDKGSTFTIELPVKKPEQVVDSGKLSEQLAS